MRTYVEGEGAAYRLNPVLKLLLFTLFIFLPSLFLSPLPPAITILCVGFFSWTGGGPGPIQLGRRMVPFLVLAAGLFVYNTLFFAGGAENSAGYLIAAGPFTITFAALVYAASISLRIIAVIVVSAVFTATTPPAALVASLIRQGHIPYRFAFAVFAVYRFIPLTAGELRRVREARRIRGVAPRGFSGRLKGVRDIFLPLLTHAIRRAERMGHSLDARSFSVPGKKYPYVETRIVTADVITTLLLVAAGGTLMLLAGRSGLLAGFMAGVTETFRGTQPK